MGQPELRIFAVDTETTALPGPRDRIVQFSVRVLDRELLEIQRWTEFVNPGMPIPPHATKIHGITDADVAHAPRFWHFAPRLLGLLSECHVFMAYNHRFDHGILDLELKRSGHAGMPGHLRFLDPLLIERRVNGRTLGETFRRYTGRALTNAHKADADTDAMVEVLRHQRRVHADRLASDVEGLLEPIRNPVDTLGRFYADADGVVRFAFGRHRDRAVADEPAYLRWVARSFTDEQTREWARRLLAAPPGSQIAQIPQMTPGAESAKSA